ncbi:MAG: hypothetical protein ACK40G_13895 [Cytophagaceae bacterium]
MWKKALIGAGVLGLGTYLWRLNNLSKNLVVTQSIDAKTTKTNILGIPTEWTLTVIPTLKNPSKVQVSVNQPFVQLFLIKDDPQGPFASSAAVPKKHIIPAFGQVTLDPIVIPISLMQLMQKAGQVIANAQKTKKLGIYSKTITFVNGNIRVEKPDFKEIGL